MRRALHPRFAGRRPGRLAFKTARTGPKISSWATRERALKSATIVGPTKNPRLSSVPISA